jgi:rubrerythrin
MNFYHKYGLNNHAGKEHVGVLFPDGHCPGWYGRSRETEMPDKKLNLKEIIEMAIQVETAGAAYYKKLQETAGSDETKKLFEHLEKAEYSHIEDFNAILKKAVSRHQQHDYATTEEDLLYLRAFASRRIFPSPLEAVRRAEKAGDVIEAIDLALDFEIKSADFYREMAEMIENPEDSASVLELERQEKEHAADLFKMREKLEENKQ